MADIKQAFETATKGGVLVINAKDGECQDGCGAETAKGRSFKQGHDARLRGLLGRAHLAGIPVKVNGKQGTAEAAMKGHGFPLPKPKAARKRSTAKKSTAKKSTAKRSGGRKRSTAKATTPAAS